MQVDKRVWSSVWDGNSFLSYVKVTIFPEKDKSNHIYRSNIQKWWNKECFSKTLSPPFIRWEQHITVIRMGNAWAIEIQFNWISYILPGNTED